MQQPAGRSAEHPLPSYLRRALGSVNCLAARRPLLDALPVVKQLLIASLLSDPALWV